MALTMIRMSIRTTILLSLALICALLVTSDALLVKANTTPPPLLYTSDLLGHWQLDEGSGRTLNDSSGKRNHLQLGADADWQEGYLGAHAIRFHEQVRASNYQLSGHSAITQKKQFTLTFWHKPSATKNNKVFASLGGVIQVSQGSDASLHIDMLNTYAHFSKILTVDRWQHVALRFTAGTVFVYVNGVEKGSKAFPGTFTASGYFSFGGIWAYDTPNQLDDVRLYSNALTVEQIKQLAAQLKTEKTAPAVPNNLVMVGKNNSAANFEWSASTDNIDVVGYQLYVNDKQALFTEKTSATITNLLADQNYAVTVRAKDVAGNLSASSTALRFRTDRTYNPQKGAVGINFDGVCDYCRETMFYDVFKMARPWMNWSYPDYKFDKDEHGNIRSLEAGREAYSMMLIANDGRYKKGRYLVTYDGEGVLEFWQRDGSKIISQSPGKMEVDVQGDGLWLTLKSVNPADYIRNIRAIHIDDLEVARAHTFRRDFIERWKDFRVTRFMSTMNTNNTKIVEWKDRTTPQHLTQGGWDNPLNDGMAVEHMVELTNELGSDPWFNMPTMANDDYVRQFATYVRDHLHDEAKVYIEYSNETWNTIFFQYNYCVQEGKKLGYSGSDAEISAKFHAHRAKQMFAIWEEVFGSEQRLVKVIGGFHYGGAHYAKTILEHEEVYKEADAYATAPYFAHDYGGTRAEWVKKATPSEIFADMQNEVAFSNKMTKEIVDQVDTFALDTVAYEGGQHMAPIFVWQTNTFYQNDDVLVNKLAWLNRQPQMYDIYQQHFDGWKAAGGRLNVTYSAVTNYGRYGSFGLLEYANQPLASAYKYRSTIDWLKSHPVWWGVQRVDTPGETQANVPAPSTVTISQITMNTMRVAWQAPAYKEAVKSYELFVDGMAVASLPAQQYSYVLSNLMSNRKYSFGVKAHYDSGEQSAQTYANASTLTDLQPPTSPKGLNVSTSTMNSFNVSWSAANDNVAVVTYEVYLNGVKMTETQQLSHAVTGLRPATAYTVVVRARDAANNRSPVSVSLSVRTAPDTQPPNAPQQVYAANIDMRAFTLYWVPVNDAYGISAYEVYESGKMMARVTNPFLALRSLTPRTTYKLRVRAVDQAGNLSDFSSEVVRQTNVDQQVPSTPRGLRVTRMLPATTQLELAWERASDNDSVVSYQLYRNGTVVLSTVQTTALVSVNALGQTASYAVRAVDAAGNLSVVSKDVQAMIPQASAGTNHPILVEIQSLRQPQGTMSTVLQYRLLRSAHVTVRLLDEQATQVAVPLSRTWLAANTHTLTIRHLNLPEGRYKYELIAEGVSTQRWQGVFVIDNTRPVVSSFTVSGAITNEVNRSVSTMQFSLSERSFVHVTVHDGKGAIVRTLLNQRMLMSGRHSLQWNGFNQAEQLVADGMYEVRVTAVDEVGTRSSLVSTQLRVEARVPQLTQSKQNVASLKVKYNNRLTISFHLSEEAKVEARIFDFNNQLLLDLAAGNLQSGLQTLQWNGRNKEGKYTINGDYYVRIKATDSANKSSTEWRVNINVETAF